MARSKEGICLNQRKLISDAAGLADAKICDTPMEQNARFTSKEFDDSVGKDSGMDPPVADASAYIILFGRLIYLTVTRPDICFAVQTLNQFMNHSKTSHLEAALKVLRYLKSAPDKGIFLTALDSLL